MSRRRAEPPTAPPAPAVNLLSPWVHERLAMHRLRHRFGVGLLVLTLLLGGAWGYQRLELARAGSDLRGEEATATALQRRIADLGPVQQYVDGVDRRVRTVQELMLTDVAFSQVLRALAEATPTGVRLDALSVELPAAVATPGVLDASGRVTDADPARGLEQAACPGPDPFDTLVVVGCLTLSGTATDRAGVSALVERLSRRPEFVEPFVSTTTADGTDSDLVTFSGSVALRPRVFSGRYDDLRATVGLDEETPR